MGNRASCGIECWILESLRAIDEQTVLLFNRFGCYLEGFQGSVDIKGTFYGNR